MLKVTMIPKVADIRLSRHLMVNEWIGINGVFSQIIRWKRKPIWLPPAKSKLFRVPPRLRLPQEEAVEILRLYNHYRTYRKSIREYLIEMMKANQVQFDEASLRKAEEEDFIYSLNINEQWNKEVAKVREVRLKIQQTERKEQVLKSIEEKRKCEEKIMEEIEKKVKKAKDKAQTFITRENIDQVIEETLAHVVDYNGAIDINDGTMNYHLREENKIT